MNNLQIPDLSLLDNEEFLISNGLFYSKGNIPSLKNSRIFVKKMNRLIDSKTVSKYKKDLSFWNNSTNCERFKTISSELNKPLILGVHFIRDSQRKSDFINTCQLPFDLMTSLAWWPDDNSYEVLPQPIQLNGEWNTVNKDYAGMIFKILISDE